jgi:hypothetical protein
MDISLLRKDVFKQWFDYPHGTGGERIQIRYFPFKENVLLKRECSDAGFDKSGEPTLILDDIKFATRVCQAAVVGWEGFKDGDANAECTEELVSLMAENDYKFSSFVNTTCASLMLVHNLAQRKKEKN